MRANARLKSLDDVNLKSICRFLRHRKLITINELARDISAYSANVYSLARDLLWIPCVLTTEVRKASVSVGTSGKKEQIEYMDYKIAGNKTLVLLDYHILDQVLDFEEGDGSVRISHATFGMESGTLADEGSERLLG